MAFISAQQQADFWRQGVLVVDNAADVERFATLRRAQTPEALLTECAIELSPNKEVFDD